MVSVLIPSSGRPEALPVTLTSLYFQKEGGFQVLVADQNEEFDIGGTAIIRFLGNLLATKNITLKIFKNLPKRGMAQQRQFLLDKCDTRWAWYLDDDVLLENWVLGNLIQVMTEDRCGFVGMGLIGLSYKNDVRPDQQKIEWWQGPVKPERVTPQSKAWERHKLHNAANLLHVQEKLGLTPVNCRKYKVAWVGGCVLYDMEKLKQCGGFEFFRQVPEKHVGEDVLAQLRVMQKYGGCAVIPSGAYHQELSTTLEDRQIDLPKYLNI